MDEVQSRRLVVRKTPWVALLIGLAALGFAAYGFLSGLDPVGPIIALLMGLLVLIIFAEWTTCLLDRDTRSMTLVRASLRGKRTREVPFDDIVTVSAEESRTDDGGTHRVEFLLRSGESLPLTSYYTASAGPKRRLAEAMLAFIREGGGAQPSVAVTAPQPGLPELEGVTDGVHWKAQLAPDVTGSPLTRLFTPDTVLPGWSFLLMLPAGSMPMPTTGPLASLVRTAYRRSMLVLGLAETDLPGLDQAQTISVTEQNLSARCTLLTSNPPAAQAWLTPGRIVVLSDWFRGKSPARGSLVMLLNSSGLRLMARGEQTDVRELAGLATRLVAQE